MTHNLTSIAQLLDQKVLVIGDINYIQLNDTYVLTQNPFNEEIELNSLETYESQLVDEDDVRDIQHNQFAKIMAKKSF